MNKIDQDDKKFWLNEFGLRLWKNNNNELIAQRDYYWVDKIILLDSSNRYLGERMFSSFTFDED